MSEVPPPAPPPFNQAVLPVSETPEQPSSDRQAPQESSKQAPVEQAKPSGPAHNEPAVRLSEHLARLQPGAQIEATLIGPDSHGRQLVQTSVGQFLAEPTAQLEKSVQYLLEIVSSGVTFQAAIVAADGQNLTRRIELELIPQPSPSDRPVTSYRPAPGVLLPEAVPLAPGTQSPTAAVQADTPAPALQIGNQLAAALVTRQNEPGALPTPILAGSTLFVRVLDFGPPPRAGAQAGNSTPPNVPPNTATNAAAIAAGAASTAGTPTAFGGQNTGLPETAQPTTPVIPPPSTRISPLNRALDVAQQFRGAATPSISSPDAAVPQNPRAIAATVATRIKGSPIAVGGPGTAPGTPGTVITGIAVTSALDTSFPAAGSSIAGTASVPIAPTVSSTPVSPATTGGATLLRTPMGLMRLDTPAPLAIGSTVALEVMSMRPPDDLSVREIPAPLLNMAATWPLLDEVMSTLAAADPALAAQTSQRVLPAPTQRLGPTLLFFMAALNLGDARSWLGQAAVSALEKAGRQDLLRRLGGEFSRIRGAGEEPFSRDPGSSEWRPTVFPFLDGNAVRPLTMYTRHHQHDDSDGDNPADTRFVLEVELSALGPMQFDGLIRRNNFDLVIRSHAGLPEKMRDHIRELFRGNLEQSGLEGGVQFQIGRPFPVSPKGDYLRNHGNSADPVVV